MAVQAPDFSVASAVSTLSPVVFETDDFGRFARLTRALELIIPLTVLVFLAAACFIWPLIFKVPSPTAGNLSSVNLPPFSPGHLFGTDPRATTSCRGSSTAGESPWRWESGRPGSGC